MSRRRTPVLAVFAAAALAACTPKPPQPAVEDIQAARRAALLLDVRFRTELLDRLDREPVVGVYLAYHDHAQQFVHEAQQTSGLVIRRIGLRVRNPANAPDDWEADKLEKFDFLVNAGYDINQLETAEIVTEGKTRWFRWIKPVGMNETCMVCHGDAISPDILRLLKQDYVEDNATGYLPYEMRGAYAVKKRLE